MEAGIWTIWDRNPTSNELKQTNMYKVEDKVRIKTDVMKYKITYQGDGTKENGEKIIAKLESLGGFNLYDYKEYSKDRYYSIDADDIIIFTNTLPKTRTLIPLESTQKLFKLL